MVLHNEYKYCMGSDIAVSSVSHILESIVPCGDQECVCPVSVGVLGPFVQIL